MLFFERLFATYYFMVLKLRKINRIRIEDFQAMILVCICESELLGMLLVIIDRVFKFTPTYINKVNTLLFLCIILYFNNAYFLSKRQRRNAFIDSYRELEPRQKIIWRFIGVLIFIIPLVVIYFVGPKHRTLRGVAF